MDRERYEDNAYWRQRYMELCCELGHIINDQQDVIIALGKENKRLKRESWNLRKTKRRRWPLKSFLSDFKSGELQQPYQPNKTGLYPLNFRISTILAVTERKI